MIKKIIHITDISYKRCVHATATLRRVLDDFDGIELVVKDLSRSDCSIEVIKYSIKLVPSTIILDSKGEELCKISGDVEENDLKNIISEIYNKNGYWFLWENA